MGIFLNKLYFCFKPSTMKLKAIVLAGTLIVATVSTIMFIRISNDHKECQTNTTQATNEDGTVVTTEEHICKERFNF